MKLPIYYLRQIVNGFLLAAGSLFLIALPGMTVASFSKLGGVGMATAIRFIPLVFGELGPFLLPVAFMLAVIVTYGRSVDDNEWVAIAAAGVRPARILVPTLLLAALVAGGHYWLVSYLAPHLKVAQKQYLHEAILKEARSLQPGRTEMNFGPVHISARERVDNKFRNVLVYWADEREDGPRFALAETAVVDVQDDVLRVRFTDALTVTSEGRGRVGNLEIQIGADELSGKTPGMRMKNEYLVSPLLRERILTGGLEGKELRVAVYEWHRRMAMSLSYLLFTLLGAPSGVWLFRRGVPGAFMITACYGMLYYMMSLDLFRRLSHTGAVDPALGAWATTLVLVVPGLWMARNRMAPRR